MKVYAVCSNKVLARRPLAGAWRVITSYRSDDATG
jgi:hypothetical protein